MRRGGRKGWAGGAGGMWNLHPYTSEGMLRDVYYWWPLLQLLPPPYAPHYNDTNCVRDRPYSAAQGVASASTDMQLITRDQG